ncbi:M61 family metallopeptidase [Haliangium ochraceum]|uniref:Peptidase M61 domain protein n=1 Tax=Haliangium ochraceum (strain DSM 14365 / JCM 11303 / SMP-2) TaxID=502025 RepID=D0LTY1_HALO1|nr:PDZ domain-containing protein [Haliangium ochraceum]ACY15825.1 peptidase M61 domain protein [Haliangium ochraceum DSM 14365]
MQRHPGGRSKRSAAPARSRLPRVAILGIAFALSLGTACRGGGASAPPGDEGAEPGASRRAPSDDPASLDAPPLRMPAPGDPRVLYQLSFPAPQTHYVEVEAVIPVPAAATEAEAEAGEGDGAAAADSAPGDAMDLFMAVWTPGSYLVREFSRHVEDLRVSTPAGATLAVDKVRKNRWRVRLLGNKVKKRPEHVVVRYRVYAREMSVRTSFVDADIAVLNGASLFVSALGGQALPHEVRLSLPAAWSDSVTGMPAHPEGAPHHYLAEDYDALVDAPIVAGNPTLHSFEAGGANHRIATFLSDERWDGERVAADIETLVRAQIDFWRQVPYRDYVFLAVLSGTGGGLEHGNSTLMMGDPWLTRERDSYLRWLGLASHEFFHTWNVKRLRPVALGPFDYESEVYTESLWVAEGITSYYADLLLRRAGLIDDAGYLRNLSRRLGQVQRVPGRLVQPLAASSYDAWIKFYRNDENSDNSSVSYYSKGALVGFLLDAEIRRQTRGTRSLDDLMRLAYARYAGERGFTEAEFRALAGEIAGADLSAFFDQTVDSAAELSFEPALEYFGLTMGSGDDAAAGSADEPAGWLGAKLREDGGRSLVSEVPRDTPAHRAGVNVGDELLAIDERRISSDGPDDVLRYLRPGERVELLVARRERLRRLAVTLGDKPDEEWKLALAPRPSNDQARRRGRWLSGL